ncbi:hypothetical protein KQX54_006487 [Cotesia glomerata]|uniref:Uncharacterized protein n=1 Tax=Cotesia glomerata TaxID=32391 RepID=A0AAV7I7I4_COTGL|nr:hypothetical protein KQX54_006487 [Cotesia glomerata]
MRGIIKISLGVLIVVRIINSGGQVLAKKSNNDKFDLSAIESRKIAVKSDRLWNQGIIPYIVKKALAWKHSCKNFEYKIVVREVGHAMGFVFENEPEYEKLINKTDENSDMVYQCPSCGKTLQEPTGTFGTPVDSNNSLIKGNGTEICE